MDEVAEYEKRIDAIPDADLRPILRRLAYEIAPAVRLGFIHNGLLDAAKNIFGIERQPGTAIANPAPVVCTTHPRLTETQLGELIKRMEKAKFGTPLILDRVIDDVKFLNGMKPNEESWGPASGAFTAHYDPDLSLAEVGFAHGIDAMRAHEAVAFACPDCHGTRLYQPLTGPAEPCRTCQGKG